MIRLTYKGYGQSDFDTGAPDVSQSLPSDMMLKPPMQTVAIRAQAMSEALRIQQQAEDDVLWKTGLDGEFSPSNGQAPQPEVEDPQPDLGSKRKWWPWALGAGGLVVVGVVTAVVLSRRRRR